jgi:hypothetical protein
MWIDRIIGEGSFVDNKIKYYKGSRHCALSNVWAYVPPSNSLYFWAFAEKAFFLKAKAFYLQVKWANEF